MQTKPFGFQIYINFVLSLESDQGEEQVLYVSLLRLIYVHSMLANVPINHGDKNNFYCLQLRFISEQFSLTSVPAPRLSHQPPLPITAKHCLAPSSSNSASKTALFRAPANGLGF